MLKRAASVECVAAVDPKAIAIEPVRRQRDEAEDRVQFAASRTASGWVTVEPAGQRGKDCDENRSGQAQVGMGSRGARHGSRR